MMLQLVSRMPLNHFYVNLLVTAIMSKLVAYPLPLLRTLLFTQTPQPESVSSPASHEDAKSAPASCQLYATLLTVRQWFDCYINYHFPQDDAIHGDRTVARRSSSFSALSAIARSEIIELAWTHSSYSTVKCPLVRTNSGNLQAS